MQQDFRSGTGGHNDRFAFQVRKIFDCAALLGQQTGAHDKDGVREGRLFLTLEVVSGGTTLEVKGAVLQQWNTVL